jgi:hypothetical protein
MDKFVFSVPYLVGSCKQTRQGVTWQLEDSEGIGLTLMKSPLKFQREIIVVINIIIEFLA